MHIIRLEGIKLYAYHGCLEEEARIGANYIVDVIIETDFTEAALNDDLSKTVDYVDVYQIVKTEMSIRAKLIENVAYRIMEKIKKNIKNIYAVEVTLTKINPPVNGYVEKTSVSIKN